MRLTKKAQCLKCNSMVDTEGACTCGFVQIVNDKIITEGVAGKDYVDMSAQLLNEIA